MASVSKQVHIDRSIDEVWAVAGDIGSIHRWLAAIEACEVRGDERTCRVAGGGEIRERILSRDEAGRSYEYTIVAAPFPLESYRSRIAVTPDGDGSLVTWSAEFGPDDSAPIIDATYEAGLQGLREHLEG